MPDVSTKICCDCGQDLPLSSFCPRWQYKHGARVARKYHIAYCYPCMSRRSRSWQKEHDKEYKKYQKFYHEAKKLKG